MPDFETVVAATPDERRFILKELLKDSYALVPFDELERATPAMVRGWFRAYPVDGHTLRKAISFFVSSAKEAELPMSNAARKMARAPWPAAATVARAKQDTQRGVSPGTAQERQTMRTGGPSARRNDRPSFRQSETIINLESGGTVTVDLAVDLFGLSNRDREFVLKLVDLTKGYLEQPGDPPAEESEGKGNE